MAKEKKMKPRFAYMHTLNGKPAAWSDNYGGYIHYVMDAKQVDTQPDLKTIRAQQVHDLEQSQKQKHPVMHKYGYIRIKLPA